MVSIPHLRASYIVLAMTKDFLVEHPILKSIPRLLVMLKMTIVVKEIETKFHKGSYSEEHPFGFLNIILIPYQLHYSPRPLFSLYIGTCGLN